MKRCNIYSAYLLIFRWLCAHEYCSVGLGAAQLGILAQTQIRGSSPVQRHAQEHKDSSELLCQP